MGYRIPVKEPGDMITDSGLAIAGNPSLADGEQSGLISNPCLPALLCTNPNSDKKLPNLKKAQV